MTRLTILIAASLALLHYADRLHARLSIAACVDRGWSPDDCVEAKWDGYRLPTRTSPKVEM